MTYESLANGFEVNFDDKSMGNPTANVIATAMHNTANTVTNEWTNGTTANELSAKVQSYVKKANGYGAAATSTSTYAWTVTQVTKATLQTSDYVGDMLVSDNTKLKLRVDSNFAANKIAYFGLGASANIYLAWTLKTIKRLKANKSTVNLSTTVTADSAKWSNKDNSATGKKF